MARPILKSTALTSPFFSSQVQVPPRVRAAHHARASSSRTSKTVGTRSEVAHRVVRQLSSPRAGASRRRIALHAPFSECRVESGTHRATRRSLKFPYPASSQVAVNRLAESMDAHMGAEKASGVLASSQGNAFRAVAPGAKAGEFAKPAPVVTNTAAGANAGKENATTTRGAAAAASTSGEPDQPEKRWQVRDHPKPSTTDAHAHRARRTRRVSGPRRRSHSESLANGYHFSRRCAFRATRRRLPASDTRPRTHDGTRPTRARCRVREAVFLEFRRLTSTLSRSFTSPPVVPAARECRATTAERFRHRQASGPR